VTDSRFPDAPDRVARLPVDRRGFPIPWFVAWFDGEPDFRVTDGQKLGQAWASDLCWICGGGLGAYRAWVIGPICVVEGACPEPPAHLDCGQFAARCCPFLANPLMRRNDRRAPQLQKPGGIMVAQNSEATALWVTRGRGAQPFRAAEGVLFRLNPPERIEWYSNGRLALAHEVSAALDAGLPILRGSANDAGPAAVADLERRLQDIRRWTPAE
jgi:hypothetical protein